MTPRLYSAVNLALGGVILLGLGFYFLALRPPLLPEDARYMGASLAQIQSALPGLSGWLRRVFWVMGGYMLSAGMLTLYVAVTAVRTGMRGAQVIVAVAGLCSIGTMTVVNFAIGSDFRWLLLAFSLPWVVGSMLYGFETQRRAISQ